MDYDKQGVQERRPCPCRGMYMRTEKIDRERALSGWNPYRGEEEADRRMENARDELRGRERREQMPQVMPLTQEEPMQPGRTMSDGRMPEWGEDQMEDTRRQSFRQMPERPGWEESQMEDTPRRPFRQMPDYAQILGEEQDMEHDLRRMQAMCPQSARILIPYVEEACDRMEYEGSPMYMEHPDREIVLRISMEIVAQVKEQFPPSGQPERDEMLTMQFREDRRRPGQDWLGDMARTMLLHEMHRRRCRYGRCRRWRR